MWKIIDIITTEVLASASSFRGLPLHTYFPQVGFCDAVDNDFTFTSDTHAVLWEVEPVSIPEPETAEQARLRAKYTIESHIQSKASEYGFDSIITAGYRAALPESQWYSIGRSLALWADNCWVASNDYSTQVMGEFVAGTRTTFPTNDEIVNALPIFVQV